MSTYNKDKYAILQAKMMAYTQTDSAVAFSGGADSSLILKLACEAAKVNGTKVYAVTVQTKLHPKGDLEIAKRVVEETGAIHQVLEIDELNETGIEHNPKDRCYRCKKGIFEKIRSLASELGITNILEGTNEDDLHQYRPGIQALKELGIISPLAESLFTKEEVRALSEELGISVADRPSMPCLATRIPYGDTIKYELLDRIDDAEEFIRNLDFYNVRVRVHGNIARIEVDERDMEKLMAYRKEIIAEVKAKGFPYVTLDLEGFRSGSMDL